MRSPVYDYLHRQNILQQSPGRENIGAKNLKYEGLGTELCFSESVLRPPVCSTNYFIRLVMT